MITQKEVREFFDYSYGELFWKKDSGYVEMKGKKAGTRRSDRRVMICINNKKIFRSRLVFLFHHGYLPEVCDHINRNPSDDRIENLRDVNKSENCRNQRCRSNTGKMYITKQSDRNRTKPYHFLVSKRPYKQEKIVLTSKHFKTLEEAVIYRDNWLKENDKFRYDNLRGQ